MAQTYTFDDVPAAIVADIKELARKQIAETARVEHAKIMEAHPEPLGFEVHADGQEGASFEAVKPGGVIVVDYNRLDLIAQVALDTLRQLSPVESGDYARGHVIMLNGAVVDDLKGWKPGDVISISNPEPYTRKIEGGPGKEKFSSHPHVYEKAQRVLARRFGNIASIYFIFDKAPPGAIHDWAQSARGAAWASKKRGGNPNYHTQWLTNQPTLVIREYR